MDFIKFCVGIDCGLEELVCCFSGLDQDLFLKDFAIKSFTNNPKGFTQLIKWVGSFKASKDVAFVMEATGVYHEDLAFFLDEKGLLIVQLQLVLLTLDCLGNFANGTSHIPSCEASGILHAKETRL